MVKDTVVRREKGGVRIGREVDGSQSDARVLAPSSEGLVEYEFASTRRPLLLLPDGELEPGMEWDMDFRRRARITEIEALDLGGSEVEALKIQLEQHFDEASTTEPGWYPNGHIWMAQGIGMIRADTEGARVPRSPDNGSPSTAGPDLDIRVLLELEQYKVGEVIGPKATEEDAVP